MTSIIGLLITTVMVFGGYTLAGGKMSIILHSLPFEMMMIGGAAIGAFLVANDMSTIKHTGSDLMAVFKGPKWKKTDYQDLLCLMHEIVRILRESPVEIEGHIENPTESSLFGQYPRIQKDHATIELICDTVRSMIMNFDDSHQVEDLFEKQLEGMGEESLHGAHALQNMADALPALGIVAAVLGVIKTMASIDKPPEILGQMIGGALVGTFLGVFLAYGIVGPFATKVQSLREEEHYFLGLVREVIVSSLQQHPPAMCVEVARRNSPKRTRPSFQEMDEALRDLKKVAA